MPDATEWLVEFVDAGGRPAYEKFKTVNEAIPFLHKVLGTSQRPRLYRETPITLTIDVDGDAVKPKRRYRRKAKDDAANPDAAASTAKLGRVG